MLGGWKESGEGACSQTRNGCGILCVESISARSGKEAVTSIFPAKVLLASDGSEDAALAARAAVDISGRSGSELHVVHVWRSPHSPSYIGPLPDSYETWHAGFEREAEDLLAGQTHWIEEAGGTVAGAHLRMGRPADEVADLANELGVGLVIVGSRGLGAVRRLILGSVSEGVVHFAPCSTLVMRNGNDSWPPRRIVVGEDLSEEARRAAELAVNLGKLFNAAVRLVLAYSKLPETLRDEGLTALDDDERVRHWAWSALWRLSDELEDELGYRPLTRIVAGDAAAVIQAAAEETGEPTLVVVGNRGLGTVRRTVLGSVSTDVLRSVRGPVLIVKPPSSE